MANFNTTTAEDGASYPDVRRPLYMVEKTVDVAELVAKGQITSFGTGDVITMLKVPARTYISGAGVEVLTGFKANTVISAGVNGASNNIVGSAQAATSAGFLAAGTNGSISLASRVGATATTATIKLAGASGIVSGKVRLYLLVSDIEQYSLADEVDRDQLA
jgi:hypothetical protein